MIGKGLVDKYSGGVNKSTILGPGAFSAGGLLGKDGSGTDRSTYHYQVPGGYPTPGYGGQPPTISGPREDKSFVSPGGSSSQQQLLQPPPSSGVTHGAVSALNLAGGGLKSGGPLDSSYVMKNILNTPSSGKSKSGISEQDALDLQKH